MKSSSLSGRRFMRYCTHSLPPAAIASSIILIVRVHRRLRAPGCRPVEGLLSPDLNGRRLASWFGLWLI
jgi:hypothetical protein